MFLELGMNMEHIQMLLYSFLMQQGLTIYKHFQCNLKCHCNDTNVHGFSFERSDYTSLVYDSVDEILLSLVLLHPRTGALLR